MGGLSELISLVVMPSGKISLDGTGDSIDGLLAASLRKALTEGEAELFLHLATTALQAALPAGLSYLREIGREYLSLACHAPLDSAGVAEVAAPSRETLALLAMRCPPLTGAEYVTAEVLGDWWRGLDAHVRELSAGWEGGLSGMLAMRSPVWRTVGRVTFHLAENKKDAERPFAFMATYTSRLSAAGRPQHLPLSRALQEYAGAGNREGLLKLLLPVNEAARRSEFVKQLADTGAVYRAAAWKAEEAYRFLADIPAMEEAGLVVRMPEWWKSRRPARPSVSVTIGDARPSRLSMDALLDFDVAVTLNGEELTEGELQELLRCGAGLVRIRDQWVEVDALKLQAALEHWRKVQATAGQTGVSFHEAMRLLSGAQVPGTEAATPLDPQWVGLSAGEWLQEALSKMRAPSDTGEAHHPELRADLRPYQKSGVNWLRFVTQLGLGACLADDMGLGKTIQVLTLLLHLRDQAAHRPSLLVVPASLVGNWKAEAARFAPSLRLRVLHASEASDEQLAAAARMPEAYTKHDDLVLTTYGMLHRAPWLTQMRWRLAILDEAQAIKNASTRQSVAARRLQADARIAMTGTPVENRLGDLWSLFDFLNPGLLGSARAFASYAKRLASAEAPDYTPLRSLIRPYVLRRLKTDKSIIADLPDKIEMKAYCPLSKRQATLYEQAVRELEQQLKTTDGEMARRGAILGTLLRLKQICNHPSQWLGDGEYAAADSGKFERLGELCQELASRQQKVLVFTQFREATAPLAELLASVFGRPGLVLHGQTAIRQRQALVNDFQREDGPPFFVLSIKAGGTGLNLTAASTVIHFDRWWNPAVENQATDRAFRIGQKRNVVVHKFVCSGTVEERIDEMIEDKQALSRDVLEGGGETALTEMDNQQLLAFLSLDLSKATEN